MSMIDKLRPTFWNYEDVAAGSHSDLYSFRRKWWRMVILTAIVALTPLILLSVFEYRMTKKDMKAEAVSHANQMVTSMWHSVSFFLSEHRSAMAFVLNDNTQQALLDSDRLDAILNNLNVGLGGFVDLSVVSSQGRLLRHAGPQSPEREDFCEDICFKKVVERGFYISDLVSNRLPEQYLAMAIRKDMSSGDFFVLRATLDIKPIADLMAKPVQGPKGDAFIVNAAGALQTPSMFYGAPYKKIPLAISDTLTQPRVFETTDHEGARLFVGVAPIADTSLIVVVVHNEHALMGRWRQSRINLFIFLGVSVAAILLMVLGMATYLVNRIHAADQKRITELHKVEYANKMVSLGRLSAGVGHEINNPIAIVNEKIGLIKDLLLQIEANPFEQKMVTLADDIIQSIRRCGDITNRLINFGRYQELRLEPLDLKNILHDLLAFMEKEAESQCIVVSIDVPENLPMVKSDKNCLQQIFLNIINNAFAAMEEGGRLDIKVTIEPDQRLVISFVDTGRGISPEDLKKVFEPFFSSKSSATGTGLGLSVTYGLVAQIGGTIRVESETDKGARFIVALPVNATVEASNDDCRYYPPDESTLGESPPNESSRVSIKEQGSA